MTRLIEADAIQIYTTSQAVKHIVTDLIDAQPTVDAVPVIRCKDCKYYFKSGEKCQLIDTRLHFYEADKRWADDSFCSWAERKEDDKAG